MHSWQPAHIVREYGNVDRGRTRVDTSHETTRWSEYHAAAKGGRPKNVDVFNDPLNIVAFEALLCCGRIS